MNKLLANISQSTADANQTGRRALAAEMFLSAFAAQAGALSVFTSDTADFDTHTFYYDDGKEVTLIASQFAPTLTTAMVRKVRSETRSPITRVIITHPSPNKFNGLAYLHGLGVRSISSTGVANAMPTIHIYKKAFRTQTMKVFFPDDYPAFENVQERFDGQHLQKLASDETITLLVLKHAGVALQKIAVRPDATGGLLVSDLVHHHAHAWREGGLVDAKPVPRISEWNTNLNELPALSAGFPVATVHRGRGEFVALDKAVEAKKSYLLKTDTLVRSYVGGLGVHRTELWNAAATAKHSSELGQRFTAAFPDYRLPYMVRYAFYGLVRVDASAAITPGQRSLDLPPDFFPDWTSSHEPGACSTFLWINLCVSKLRAHHRYGMATTWPLWRDLRMAITGGRLPRRGTTLRNLSCGHDARWRHLYRAP